MQAKLVSRQLLLLLQSKQLSGTSARQSDAESQSLAKMPSYGTLHGLCRMRRYFRGFRQGKAALCVISARKTTMSDSSICCAPNNRSSSCCSRVTSKIQSLRQQIEVGALFCRSVTCLSGSGLRALSSAWKHAGHFLPCCAAGMLGCGLSRTFTHLLVARFVTGMGSALQMSGSQLFLADISQRHNRARSLGTNHVHLPPSPSFALPMQRGASRVLCIGSLLFMYGQTPLCLPSHNEAGPLGT